jgi:aminopeptidase YwaD
MPLLRKPVVPLTLLVAALVLSAPLWADPSITAAEVSAHVRYLASDELAGRGSGTPGGRKAADYIARQFRAGGARPAGERGSYFQRFAVITAVRLAPGNRFELRSNGGAAEELRVKNDFMPAAVSAAAKASGPLVFAGYGICQPELQHDDYGGIDARGKVLIVLRRGPEGGEHGMLSPYTTLRYKATVARDHGARAVLFVTGPRTSREEDLGNLEPDGSFSDAGIPALIVRRAFIERLLSKAAHDLGALQASIDEKGPHSFDVPGSSASLQAAVRQERAETSNVVARIEGSDPSLEDQVVVVGAHYDHLGMGGPGSLDTSGKPAIHHGADDNASGTAGVLELAEYFAANRRTLGRSAIFIAFSGEEMGLLGSAYYVRHPVVPLERTVAMVNMDMIGREKNDMVYVLGTKTSPEWQPLLGACAARIPLAIKSGGGSGFGDSDQSSFYARNVPVLFFFTGVHEDYHRPSDTWEKINAAGEARILEFVAEAVKRISTLPRPPRFARADDVTPGGSPGFAVYVGTVPDYSETTSGVTLTGVREGSPAEKAGLKPGDVIVEFGGRKITNVYDYTYALRDARAGAPVQVVVLRGSARLNLTVVPVARR